MSTHHHFDRGGLERLLEDKSYTAEQRRRIVATSIALDMIGNVVSAPNSTYKLAEEMQNLPKYVEAIELSMAARK